MTNSIKIVSDKLREPITINIDDYGAEGEGPIAVCNLETGEILFNVSVGDQVVVKQRRWITPRDQFFELNPERDIVRLYNEGLAALVDMELTANEYRVLFCLIAHITPDNQWCALDGDTVCSIQTLAEITGLTERTVKTLLRSMETKELIRIDRSKRVHRYIVNERFASNDVWFTRNMIDYGREDKQWLTRRSLHSKFVIADRNFLKWLAGQRMKLEAWRVLLVCMRRTEFNRATIGRGNGRSIGIDEIREETGGYAADVRRIMKELGDAGLIREKDEVYYLNPVCVIRGVRVPVEVYKMFEESCHCDQYQKLYGLKEENFEG